MPLQKLELRPGVNRESTSYANEGGFFAGDKIRFRSGYAEKLGGWANQSSSTFLGICHTLWNWITFGGSNLLAVGTNSKYYIEKGRGRAALPARRAAQVAASQRIALRNLRMVDGLSHKHRKEPPHHEPQSISAKVSLYQQ